MVVKMWLEKNTPKQWRQDKELDWLELKRDSQWNNLEVNYPPRPVKVPLVIGENGYNLPNNTRLKQLSKVLDVSTTYLLNGSYTLRDMHMMPEIKRNVLEKQLKKTIEKNNSIIDSNLSNAINNIEEDNLTVSQKIYLTNAIKYLKTGSRIEFPDGSTPIAYLAALLNTLLRYDSLINDSEKNTDEKKEYQEFYENDLLKEFTALVTELNKHYSK